MIIKMALAKDGPECVLDRSLGASVDEEWGGGAHSPFTQTLCSKHLEVPSGEAARQGHTAGTWQRQDLNLSLFDALEPETQLRHCSPVS